MGDEASTRPRSTLEILSEQLVAIVAVGTFGVGTLAAIAGVDNAWMIFVAGWFLAVPILAIVSDGLQELVSREEPDRATASADEATDETADALETLRERYARGEIDELTFERKVEALLETETVADAQDAIDRRLDRASGAAQSSRSGVDRNANRDADETSTESDPAYER